MDLEEGAFERLKLNGEIEIGVHDARAHLAGLEFERQGARTQLVLRGKLGELRALAGLAPAYAELLSRVASEDAQRDASIRLLASPKLGAEIALAIEALGAVTPDSWLGDPTLANLLFALDRYEPEAVGISEP